MPCTGLGIYTFYLYDESGTLVSCHRSNSASYTVTGLTDPGVYTVTADLVTTTATTQVTVTGNESCCWETAVFQPCDEGCAELKTSTVTKVGDGYSIILNPSHPEMERYYRNLNISTGSRSFPEPDLNSLFNANEGSSVYFDQLMRAYQCCTDDLEQYVDFVAPCLNYPTYKVIRFCNICDENYRITDWDLNGSTNCSETWDVRFMYYSASTDSSGAVTAYLTEFDPLTQTGITVNHTCIETSPVEGCNCFYVAIGFRADTVQAVYSTLNITMQDNNPPSNTKDFSIYLKGTASHFDDCPEAVSCDCIVVANTNPVYSWSANTEAKTTFYFAEFDVTLSNDCFTDVNSVLQSVTPSDSNLFSIFTDSSAFVGAGNPTDTMHVIVSGSSQGSGSILFQFSGFTDDPFGCSNIVPCTTRLTVPIVFTPPVIVVPPTTGVTSGTTFSGVTFIGDGHNFGTVGDGCCVQEILTLETTGDPVFISNVTATWPYAVISPSFGPPVLVDGQMQITVQYCASACTGNDVLGSINITAWTVGPFNRPDRLLGTFNPGFWLVADCTDTLSFSNSEFVFIQYVGDSTTTGWTVCNQTSYPQTIGISNCVTQITATTVTIDPLGNGFNLINTVTNESVLTFPTTQSINPGECTTLSLNYSMPVVDRTECSIYVEDLCGNLTEIPMTGITLPYPIGVASQTITDVSCRGERSGTVTVTVSGGAPGYYYTFSGATGTQTGTMGTSVSFTNLAQGSYQLTVSGDPCNGQMAVENLAPFIATTDWLLGPLSFNVGQPESIGFANIVASASTCLVGGSFCMTVTGGTFPGTLTVGETDYTLTQSGTTCYTGLTDGDTLGLVFIDAKGCRFATTVTIPIRLPVSATYTVSDVTCYNANDGLITVFLANTIAPTSWSWSGTTTGGSTVIPSSTNTFSASTASNLTGGTYTVYYSDGNGCTGFVTPIDVTAPNRLTAVLTDTDPTCSNLNNGTISAIITGGTLPYTFHVGGLSSTTTTVSNLSAGTYSVYVEDANGCTTTATTVTLTAPSPLGLILTVTGSTCVNTNNGGLVVGVSGGTGSYTTSLSPFPVGSTPNQSLYTNLPVGNYTLTVFDANRCSTTSAFTISYLNEYCGEVTVVDGTGVTATPVNGVYYVIFPDTCVGTSLSYTFTITQTSPCQFPIDNLSGLTTDASTIYLSRNYDGDIITNSQEFELEVIFAPTAITTYTGNLAVETPYCDLVFVMSGTGVSTQTEPDTYYIDFGDVCFGASAMTPFNLTNLTSGALTVGLTNPTSQFIVQYNQVSFNNPGDGQGIKVWFAPTTPLTNPPTTFQIFTGRTMVDDCYPYMIFYSGHGISGPVTVTGVDFGCVNIGCGYTEQSTITNDHCEDIILYGEYVSSNMPGITLDVPVTYPYTLTAGSSLTFDVDFTATTVGNAVGTFGFNTSYGVQPLVFSSVTTCVMAVLGLLSPTTISESTVPGVNITFPVTVINPSNVFTLIINPTVTTGAGLPTSLITGPSGPIPIAPSGSTTLTYTFNAPSYELVQDFIITLNDTCSNSTFITVTVANTYLGYGVSGDLSINCYSGTTSFTVNPTGGTAPYTINWTNPAGHTSFAVGPVGAGTYTATITDGDSNTTPVSVVVTQPTPLVATFTVPIVGGYNFDQYGDIDGYITTTMGGGTPPYSFSWSGVTYLGQSFSSSVASLAGLKAGTYQLTVTDAAGCGYISGVTLTQPGPIGVNPTGSTNGTITMVVTGCTGPYTVQLCAPSPVFDPGGYYQGQTGCISIPIYSAATINQPNYEPLACFCCDGTGSPCTSGCPITMCVIAVHNLQPGTYPPGSIVVIGNCGDSGSNPDPEVVSSTAQLLISTAMSASTCGGVNDGIIEVTVITGGTGPYTYYINGAGQSSNVFAGLSQGYYTIKVVDSTATWYAPYGLVAVQGVLVTQAAYNMNMTVTHQTDEVNPNGSITVTSIVGGVGPYTLTVNGQLTYTGITAPHTVGGLPYGNYTLTLTDSLGCSFSKTVTIQREIGEASASNRRKKNISNGALTVGRVGGWRTYDIGGTNSESQINEVRKNNRK